MKTDSIFYRIFQQYPRSFFELLNRPLSEADSYQFTSVEIKQLAFRLDGVFLPKILGLKPRPVLPSVPLLLARSLAPYGDAGSGALIGRLFINCAIIRKLTCIS